MNHKMLLHEHHKIFEKEKEKKKTKHPASAAIQSQTSTAPRGMKKKAGLAADLIKGLAHTENSFNINKHVNLPEIK